MLLRKVIAPCNSACIHKITHTHTWTLTLKGSTIIFTQSNRKSLFTGEIIGSKFIKSQNMLMTLCRQKVTMQGKMCGFSTTIIENSAYAIFTRYEIFSSINWYHKATAPISTVLSTPCPMSWRTIIESIQYWDNQNPKAKSFQMSNKWSKLNNQKYQTLNRVWCWNKKFHMFLYIPLG